MEVGLSARDRRTLMAGVGFIGGLFVFGRGIPALRAWQNAREAEAVAASAELVAGRIARRSVGELGDSLRARQARLAAMDANLFIAPSPAAAAAAVASTAEQVADDAHVKVSALQLHADSVAVGTMTQVSVRMTATCDVYGLLALMRGLEGGDALLAVRELSVSQPEPMAPDSKPEGLRLDITVSALARIVSQETAHARQSR